MKNVVRLLATLLCVLGVAGSAFAQAQCTASWTGISATNPPPARLRAGFAYHDGIKKSVLFGGTGFQSNALFAFGDTWLFDSVDNSWEGPLDLSTRPSDRFGPAMAYDIVRKVIVLFGGAGSNNAPLNDTWQFDGTSWKKLSPATTPPSRVFHSMVYSSATGQIIMFGGLDGTTLLRDTWAFNGTDWVKLSETGPTPRELHAMAYDSARNRIVLHGGFDGRTYLSDTWEFDGATWTQLPVVSPGNRIESPTTYDPGLKLTVLFGGLSLANADLADTWTWDGATWQQLAVTGPSARRGAVSTYDFAQRGTILFGGTNNGGQLFRDTWAFGVPDADKDGAPDCTDQCPTDPAKTVPGTCGCGKTDAGGGSCVDTIATITPKTPSVKLIHKTKRVEVRMEARPNVLYILKYNEVPKRGKKARVKTVKARGSKVQIRGLKQNKKYSFSYQYQSTVPTVATSKKSRAKTVKVRFKSTRRRR